MTAPQGAPGSGDTAANPTPARPAYVVIDKDGLEHELSILGWLDWFCRHGQEDFTVICRGEFNDLDSGDAVGAMLATPPWEST